MGLFEGHVEVVFGSCGGHVMWNSSEGHVVVI